MVDLANVASTVLMGLLLIGVVVAVIRGRDWYDYSPTPGDGDLGEALLALARRPVTWMVTFFVLVAGFGAATVLLVTDASLPGGSGLIWAGFGVVLGGFAFLGAYSAARTRGRPNAQAVAEGAFLVGLLLVAVIAARLVT